MMINLLTKRDVLNGIKGIRDQDTTEWIPLNYDLNCCLLGYDATHRGRHVLSFWGNLLSPTSAQTTGVQLFYGKQPHPLLQAGSRAERTKITISDILNLINYCVIVPVHT
jgi:hypothetical protein